MNLPSFFAELKRRNGPQWDSVRNDPRFQKLAGKQ